MTQRIDEWLFRLSAPLVESTVRTETEGGVLEIVTLHERWFALSQSEVGKLCDVLLWASTTIKLTRDERDALIKTYCTPWPTAHADSPEVRPTPPDSPRALGGGVPRGPELDGEVGE
jgi:hypothetical protein